MVSSPIFLHGLQIFKGDGKLDFEELNTEVDYEQITTTNVGDNKSEESFAEGEEISPAIESLVKAEELPV